MRIVVNSNMASLLAQKNFVKATNGINTALERLSSGYRINNSSDDAAGLSIAEGLMNQLKGDATAKDNAQLGINLLQTAEGDLSVIQENLQRIRDLTIYAANGTYGTSERNSLKKEIQERLRENDRVSSMSRFNKISLLDGSSTGMVLQIGASHGSINNLKIGSALICAISSNIGLKNILSHYNSSSAAASCLDDIDSAIEMVSMQRSSIGALQNRLNSTLTSLNITSENLEAAISSIRDVDIAKEAASLTKNQILQQVSDSLLAQGTHLLLRPRVEKARQDVRRSKESRIFYTLPWQYC